MHIYCPFISPVSSHSLQTVAKADLRLANGCYSNTGQIIDVRSFNGTGLMSALTLSNSLYDFSEVLLSRH